MAGGASVLPGGDSVAPFRGSKIDFGTQTTALGQEAVRGTTTGYPRVPTRKGVFVSRRCVEPGSFNSPDEALYPNGF